ncbi:hypothetical protein FRB91_004197 [Serendipita sp. 411]|nr:hypothetical protein FRB91_004197 [Serendipita sp. 411]
MTSTTPSPSFELSIDSDNVECRQSAPQAGGSSRSGGASLAVGDLQSDRILIQSGTRKTPLVENGHSPFPRESTSVKFLQRRQKSACSTKCGTSSQCSTSSTPPPTTDDCNYLISSMWTVVNDTKVLEPYNYITLTYKSCLMKVENTTSEKLTFCYSTWADQSALLMNCLPGAPGGTCSADGVKLTVDHTPTERPVVPESSTTSSSSTLPPPPSPNENSPRTTTTTTSKINIGTTTTTTTTTITTTATATTAAGTSTAQGDSISTLTGTSAPLLHISQTIGTGTSIGTPSTFSAPGPESASPNQENHRGRTILVIIGVVAGVVTLLALVALWIWRRKRRVRKGNRAREKMEEVCLVSWLWFPIYSEIYVHFSEQSLLLFPLTTRCLPCTT